MQVTTIGVDLAKNVFQVHGIAENDDVLFNKPLRRAQFLPFFAKLEPCLIGMESCSSAHHWARELTALGHQPRPDTASGRDGFAAGREHPAPQPLVEPHRRGRRRAGTGNRDRVGLCPGSGGVVRRVGARCTRRTARAFADDRASRQGAGIR